MNWPSPIDFRDALQNPTQSLRDRQLQVCRPEKNALGVPKPRSGGFASVYKLVNGSTATAVRVFHYPNEEREQRYQAVAEHLRPRRPKCLVGFNYQAEGIKVGNKWYPLQTMDWVNGMTLGAWVGHRVAAGDRTALRRMADQWIDLLAELRAANIAHGDLQHGNVMVLNGAPVLVDYDCMCVPKLAGRRSFEEGMPAYQHPKRGSQKLSLDVDHFAAWIIFIVLRALSLDLSLWQRYVVKPDNENLLFSPPDIRQPSKSTLWTDLLALSDPEMKEWCTKLRESISKDFHNIPAFQIDVNGALEKVCKTQDWDRIWETASSPSFAQRTRPSHLAPIIEKARKLVEKRQRLQSALATNDRRQIARAYVADLASEWPACKPLVDKALQAVEAVKCLDELDAHFRKGPDEFVRCWERLEKKLSGIPEADKYRADVIQIKQRRGAWDRFVEVAQRRGASEREIATAWEYVETLGLTTQSSHPAVARGKLAKERVAAMAELHRIRDTNEQRADELFCRQWDAKQAILASCAEAVSLRDRYQVAKLRLASVAAVQKAIAKAEKNPMRFEAEVIAAAGRLPQRYGHTEQHRLNETRTRAAILTAFDEAYHAQPIRDARLARAWEDLQKSGSKLPKGATAERCRLAVKRRDLLRELSDIAQTRPIHEQDAQWLLLWDEELLATCADADGDFRRRYDLACKRTRSWQELESALQTRDADKVRDLSAKNVLRDYPLCRPYERLITELVQNADQVANLLKAIKDNSSNEVLSHLDLTLLRDHPEIIQLSDRKFVESCVRKALANGVALRPGTPFCVPPDDDQPYRIRWTWADSRLINYCVIGTDPVRFLSTPEQARDGTVQLEIHEHRRLMSSGGFPIIAEPGDKKIMVTLWPVVDLGWTRMVGVPIHAGEVHLHNGVHGASSKWSLRRLLTG